MGATLDGYVDVGAYGSVILIVRFFTPNTDTEVLKVCVATDNDGNFTIEDVPAGTYDVGIKSDNSLSNLAEDKVFVAGETTEIDFGDLRRADLTGDDSCSGADATLIDFYYGTNGDCFGYSGDWLKPAEKKPSDIVFVDGKPALNLNSKDVENALYLLL